MVAGDGETWTIVTNGANAIGLFQGMLDSNILTFNPGWEGLSRPANAFTDVRELRASLAASGLVPTEDTTAETPTGPASFKVTDPRWERDSHRPARLTKALDRDGHAVPKVTYRSGTADFPG